MTKPQARQEKTMSDEGALTDVDLSGAVWYGWSDVRGWITFSGLPNELQRQLDQTQADDYQRRHWRPSVARVRPSTPAEKLLLAHLGFSVPTNLTTTVRYPSGGIRRLEFPALDAQRRAMP